jgi:hypothetical protein
MISESFKNLLKEGLKIQNGMIKTTQRASSAIINNGKLVSTKDEAKARLDICNKCPNLSKKGGRCELCGCFVVAKVKLDFETCPAGKW